MSTENTQSRRRGSSYDMAFPGSRPTRNISSAMNNNVNRNPNRSIGQNLFDTAGDGEMSDFDDQEAALHQELVDELNKDNGQNNTGNDKDEISDTDVMEIHQVDNKYGNDEFLEAILDGYEQDKDNDNQNVAGQVDDTLGKPIQKPVKGRRRHQVTFDSDVELLGSDNSENENRFSNENKNSKQCMYCSYTNILTRYMYT